MSKIKYDVNKICTQCGHALREGTDFFSAIEGTGTGYCSQECLNESFKMYVKDVKERLKPRWKREGQRSLSDFLEV